MKPKMCVFLFAMLMVMPGLVSSRALAAPLGTSFTYQGQLKNGGQPANGTFNLVFTLWDTAAAGAQIGGPDNEPATSVVNGLFTVQLNDASQFTALPFTGEARWVQISVNGTTLSPRQPLTAAPYAHGLRLPLAAYANTTSPVIDIRNSGTGRAAYFQNSNAASNVSTFRVDTNSTSTGVTAVAGVNTGNGHGGYFEIINNANASPALVATTNGSGPAFWANGEVGIGTNTPAAPLEIRAAVDSRMRVAHISSGQFTVAGPAVLEMKSNNVGIDHPYGSIRFLDTADAVRGALEYGAGPGTIDPSAMRFNTEGATRMSITAAGEVGIGTVVPDTLLHVVGGTDSAPAGGGTLILGAVTGPNISFDTNEIMARNNGQISTLYLNNEGGDVRIGQNAGTPSTVYVPILAITGADVAEKFPISDEPKAAAPGTVMEIDPANAGKLRVARGSYNRRVAGVVSGAGDLPVGAILGNLPGHEDAPAIALSGRVWVQCDADSSSISPGDFLTTSETAGHAMKATDYPRAQGATIGKAMTSLNRGKGLVLVLVGLQ